jgi:Fe-S-cluster-containing hydrogenase component 2
VACVMAHNEEQHVLSERHFHPRITVLKNKRQSSPVTCHHCEAAPVPAVVRTAQLVV